MNAALEPVIAVAAFLVSTAVGTGVTPSDLRRVAAKPRAVLVAMLAQWLLVPAIALGAVATVRPPEPVVVAVLLAAACPSGALTNAWVFLAGADTAFSVTLTAISTVASLISLPVLLMTSLALAGLPLPAVANPWQQVLATLLGAVLVPVLVGLFLRRRWPDAVARHEGTLRRAAALGVLVVVVLIVTDQWSPLGRYAGISALIGAACAVIGGTAGYAVGAGAGLPRAGRFVVGVELVSRNMAVFALVGVPVLGRPELLAIGVVLFLVQALLCLAAAVLWRRS